MRALDKALAPPVLVPPCVPEKCVMSQLTQDDAVETTTSHNVCGPDLIPAKVVDVQPSDFCRGPDGIIYDAQTFMTFYGESQWRQVWNHGQSIFGRWHEEKDAQIQCIQQDPSPQMLPPLRRPAGPATDPAHLGSAFTALLPFRVHDSLQELIVIKCYPWGGGHAVQVRCRWPSTMIDGLIQWTREVGFGIEVLRVGPETCWSVYIHSSGYTEDGYELARNMCT